MYTDVNRLRQILINLLSNAIKYTQRGYVRLNCEIKSDMQKVLLTVQDSGVGMAKHQLAQIFKPFTKIMQNRDMNTDGVGLGLAVSLNIAKALDGDIKVESALGIGSVFTLILPDAIIVKGGADTEKLFDSELIGKQDDDSQVRIDFQKSDSKDYRIEIEEEDAKLDDDDGGEGTPIERLNTSDMIEGTPKETQFPHA